MAASPLAQLLSLGLTDANDKTNLLATTFAAKNDLPPSRETPLVQIGDHAMTDLAIIRVRTVKRILKQLRSTQSIGNGKLMRFYTSEIRQWELCPKSRSGGGRAAKSLGLAVYSKSRNYTFSEHFWHILFA